MKVKRIVQWDLKSGHVRPEDKVKYPIKLTFTHDFWDKLGFRDSFDFFSKEGRARLADCGLSGFC